MWFKQDNSNELPEEVTLINRLIELWGGIETIEAESVGSDPLFKDLGRVDGFQEYLKDTLINDMKRYFVSQTDKDRDMIKGAFNRTIYIRSKILKSLDKE